MYKILFIQSSEPALRVGVVYNTLGAESDTLLSRALWAVITSQRPQKVAALIEALLLRTQPAANIEDILGIASEVEVCVWCACVCVCA